MKLLKYIIAEIWAINAELRVSHLQILFLFFVLGLCGCGHSEASGCRRLKNNDRALIVIATKRLAQTRNPKLYKVLEISEDEKVWRVCYRPIEREGFGSIGIVAIKIDKETCQAGFIPQI
ncbi:MAG: hypothetical protein HY922_08295 [Elusimicrobia bacterium]|nr:hypothetical protein [Elusimicrobiota bacterium]